MNELPVMPIRAKYADETTKGANIDTALETNAADISSLETIVEDPDVGLAKKVFDLEATVGDSDSGLVKDVTDLETTVGDSSGGLVKKVGDLEQKTTAISYSSGTTDVDGKLIGDEIIENMSGYLFEFGDDSNTGWTATGIYAGVVKNGNKLTFVIACKLTKDSADAYGSPVLGTFTVPSTIHNKLITTQVGLYNFLDNRVIECFSSYTAYVQAASYVNKLSGNRISFQINSSNFVVGTEYYVRYETTFLLSDNLAS